ncbi:hypothetical protein FZZ91_08695 [Synechococcus sp. HB1133]|uniref:hypothetical protein n=1 Tax=unclassified Synechococcus TaxID=2626047 RepID=UPI00140DCE4A|nr:MULTISPECIES: hypothetical protein [unclassified Synechococcus]MCB4394863.1 hypothetical protein [Synechococcus sp. PH41509]MCB4422916.1 hypothetical protein [Synechococcus sp. HB1133]MCB4429593.1 hypothetical protein [Synechococcus sp. HBA1120]NHI81864.1 hypothetical protein [Synechococcus sp. HB1133]
MAEPLKRKPVTLEKFFKAANSFVEIRRHAKSVWELSRDAEGVAEWCLTRLERGLFDPCGDVDEKSYLQDVLRVAQGEMDRGLGPVRKQLEPPKAITQKSMEAIEREQAKERERAWEIKRQLLIEREERRRNGDVRRRALAGAA